MWGIDASLEELRGKIGDDSSSVESGVRLVTGS